MIKKIFLLFIVIGISHSTLLAQDYTKYVDPFIGVDGGGNLLPGPCLPFSMIRVDPDVELPQPTSGYTSKGLIDGFTQNHVSGSGGGGRYGNFMIIPQTGKIQISNYSSLRSKEKASLGYYSVNLDRWNVKAELACSERVAMHRYTFTNSDSAHILIDLSRVIDRDRGRLDDGKCLDAYIKIVSDTQVEGYGVFIGGWGHMTPYKVFFAAEFDRPFRHHKLWSDDSIYTDKSEIRNDKAGFIANFSTKKNPQIKIKISISFKSFENARRFLFTLPHWNFEQQVEETKNIWNNYLSRIKIYGATEDQLVMFYTSMYRCFIMPTDITGDNLSWDTHKPSYWDYLCIWDTFRTLNPFLTIVAPDKQRDIIISLIDIYEHKGWMPDAWLAGDIGTKQGGTNGDVLIADAIVKNLKGIDYDKAYEAMLKNVSTPSDNPRKYGRHPEYLKYGYCPSNIICGSSYTLEYAYNDFCISQVAKSLRKNDDYKKYLSMSLNCYKIFNDNLKYFWAKDSIGYWASDFSPTHHGDPWWLGPYFYEGTPAHYSTYVPHDIQGLIDRHGGNERFIDFLNNLFIRKYYTHTNEPDILTPFLYNYAGRPNLTTLRVRQLINTEYKITRDGLPGNDDSGCMSSWYIFASLGFFPVAGQDIYLISSPLFKRSEIDLRNGHKFVINATNLNSENIYIQSAMLNGKEWKKSWFQHEDIINGAQLDLTMGAIPSNWGTTIMPPSISRTLE